MDLLASRCDCCRRLRTDLQGHCGDASRGDGASPCESRLLSVRRFPFTPRKLRELSGVTVLILAGLAVLPPLRRAGDEPSTSPQIDGEWHAMAAHILAVLTFQFLVPVGHEWRHLTPAIPSMVYLASVGMSRLVAQTRQHRSVPAAVATLMAIGAGIVFDFRQGIPQKGYHGYRQIVDDLMNEGSPYCALVSSGSTGDGAFISEVILADPTRHNTALRASKILVSEGWDGRNSQNARAAPLDLASLLQE